VKPQLIGYDALGRPLRVPKSSRGYHHHVIGSSGSGKSKFLENLMREDMLSNQGFCLIDPHGTLYDEIVKFSAYRDLNREILMLNLSVPEHIKGFNFFSRTAAGDVSVQVDSRISATLHAWGMENADQTPTLERILRLIYTSLLDADLTLPQIEFLLDFSEKEIRDYIISQIGNDMIRREWQELSDMQKVRDFRDETLSAKNRLFRLLTSTGLMRFLGVKGESIDLVDAMDNQKIILVNLASSIHLSPENARVFGSLLVNQFFEAAKQRKKGHFGQDPEPFHLYLDEFQNFVSLDLCNMLDEVRKFGLFLTMSHQRFGQLDEDFEDAVLTNAQIKTVFGGLRVDDARRMAEELFIGKLDPKKIKIAVYQTKHWYKYTRDKVYSQSSSTTETDSYSDGVGDSYTSGRSTSTSVGQNTAPPSNDFFNGAAWFDGPQILSNNESSSSGFSESHGSSSSSSEGHSSSYTESYGEADIPVFVPVPFKELGSVQYYSLEEQLTELTQALKLNQQRHCFIQLPGQETQPLLIPFIKPVYVPPHTIKQYEARKALEAMSLSPAEADRRIFQERQDLLSLKDRSQSEPEIEYIPPEPAKTGSKKKKSIFDQIKDQNPDLDI
jgi:hypothetical protein